ncbi:MAG: MFS transporter [Lentisphaeria bacterium]|nr:MFS transporter [Lentisphaeria bacterium]
MKVSWKQNLFMLWASQFLIMSGFSAMAPFVPLYFKNGLNITDKGELAYYVTMFNLCGSLAYAIFLPIWGKLSDRYGVKIMLLRGSFLACFMFPMMGYISAGWMIFLRFLSAACSGTTAASQLMLVRTTPDNRQGFALGVLSTAIWGGAMMGYVLGGVIIDKFSYVFAFWMCGILYFISGIFVLFTKDDPELLRNPPKKARKSIGSMLPKFTHAVWLMMFLFVATGFVRSFETPYIALKVESMTTKATAAYWTGIVSAIVCGGAIASGVLNGYLCDRIPVRKMVGPIFIISAVGLFFQGFVNNLIGFTIARTVLYLAAGGISPLLQKVLSGATPRKKRGSVFGFSSTANGVGIMLASVVSGWAFAYCSVNWIFYIAAILTLLILPVFNIFFRRIRRDAYYRSHVNMQTEKK